MKLEEKHYQLKEVRLHVMEAGNPEGKILLFLHGFPEFWWGWRKQIHFFAEQGYRVIVPDQRGYNLSSKPAGKEAYTMSHLTEDVAALIRKLPAKKVNLVGHDWGGAVAWAMAQRYPEFLDKLIVLNLPHPQVMRCFLKTWLRQMLKSWYIGFFQLPFLPELVLSRFNFKILEQSMRRSSRPGTFTKEDMWQYKAAWRQPGALRAMINWYRAALAGTLHHNERITVPTLLLWGKQDSFLSHQMAQPSIALCDKGKLVMLPEATHWVQHEKAEEVNSLVLKFVGEG